MPNIDSRVDEILGRMDIADKAGQCLVLNFTGALIEDYHLRFIREFRAGGLRVTPHITGVNDAARIRKLAPCMTPGGYAALLRRIQEVALERRSGAPLQLVTDQEGDLSVDFLRGGFALFPSQAGLAATADPTLVERSFATVGRQLRACGINWVHSPVLDVNLNPRNPEIGMRAFSDDPNAVAQYGLAALRGLTASGVVATAKHFPGRGDSELDAHDTLDTLRCDRKRMDAVELLPYRALIAAGLPAIMTAHNAYTALEDPRVPASVSKRIVSGLLRGELGFDGVVTTDAIGMAGVQKYAGNTPNAVVMALEAGNDVVLIKDDEAATEASFRAVLDAVKSGRLTEKRLDESVRRVLRAKARAGILDNPLPDAENADATVRDPKNAAVCREAFVRGSILARDRDKLLPLDPAERVLVVEQYLPLYHEKGNDAWCHPGMFGESMHAHAPSMAYLEMHTPPTEADLHRFRERLAVARTAVFFNVFWRGSGSNRPLIREAVRAGRRVVVVTNDLYDGYFLPTAGTVLVVFGAMPEGCRAAADILYGKAKAGGTWPYCLVHQGDTVAAKDEVDHFTAGHFAGR